MKLQFKHQKYQANSVQSVIECFKGQVPTKEGIDYKIDPGVVARGESRSTVSHVDGFRNAEIQISSEQLLKNVQENQRHQNLPQSTELVKTKASPINLDIEMETGTGKTYCYIKTMFELNQEYGWTKFIIVVPSIAIREGVQKSFSITKEHFLQLYSKQARSFIYDSKQLHQIESFSSDAGINVMIINVQAFNARGKDARRIYEELDGFQTRRPIDVIKANRPIMILDEPQKMEGKKTLDSFAEFNPLFMLRYSATHKTEHNKVFRLDALDAYNQKLVKKIEVRGVTVKGLAGTNAYLFFSHIDIFKNKPPVAQVEFEQKLKGGGIKRVFRNLKKGDNLYDLSNELDQYKDNFIVANIDANTDVISFLNGVELTVGDAVGNVNESAIRRIQIREAVRAHLEKERQLHTLGIKVLSLFFIDQVAKYRDYEQADEKGEYARIFEEEYQLALNDFREIFDDAYQKYLSGIDAEKTHKGYFSIDKNSKRLVDSKLAARSTDTDDVAAYDLILKQKERLLSFKEPTRFIFSHSALKEGWDNPNVFVICALKKSDNRITRRQEVGRGLRLCVNQHGERMDTPTLVHDINRLTVIASESYKDFVTALQKETIDSLSARPRKADQEYFTGKVFTTSEGDVEVNEVMAKLIYKYLVRNDYVNDEDDHISETYHQAKTDEKLAELPEPLQPYAQQVFELIDTVYSDKTLPLPEDSRKNKTNPLNDNFDKKEFQELWARINHKAIYNVDFDSNELIKKAIPALDMKLVVDRLHYNVVRGEQVDNVSYDKMKSGQGFKIKETETDSLHSSIQSHVKYDLLGKISDGTKLTRRTVASILQGMSERAFLQFKMNPEDFISKAVNLINEQKATVIIEHLAYDTIDDKFDRDIFTANQSKQDFTNAGEPLKRHIYDYLVTDSNTERNFAKELEAAQHVTVYAKLPNGFFIPTPVGDYNPDWAIAFKEGSVKHIYFIAETKGSMDSLQLREVETTKIECAKKFFSNIAKSNPEQAVKYDVVDTFESLMTMVRQ
ncbi:type III restriction-modification system endonuclease [Leucothrix pacifica]|uniref:Restriction endonuclease subunit R n=1 Tax=Leucothrix pacifica TaxID=1247513 RepID=A0A317CI73_9GAMM|nr:DEAD/DEAH box helicase family protein [Leucothrix pacifica]PWQ97871.1 restriction endonuclease subunit R [Leucothrix pacifica]